jgi:hypothetical protein
MAQSDELTWGKAIGGTAAVGGAVLAAPLVVNGAGGLLEIGAPLVGDIAETGASITDLAAESVGIDSTINPDGVGAVVDNTLSGAGQSVQSFADGMSQQYSDFLTENVGVENLQAQSFSDGLEGATQTIGQGITAAGEGISDLAAATGDVLGGDNKLGAAGVAGLGAAGGLAYGKWSKIAAAEGKGPSQGSTSFAEQEARRRAAAVLAARQRSGLA